MDEPGRQVREAVFEATEVALEAQLRAVRALRKRGGAERTPSPRSTSRGRSQVDMAFDILRTSEPLHVATLIERIHQRFGVRIDRESLVSALSKRVARQDRFRRVGRNTFGAIEQAVADRSETGPEGGPSA